MEEMKRDYLRFVQRTAKLERELRELENEFRIVFIAFWILFVAFIAMAWMVITC